MYPKYMCILLYVIVIWCNVFFRDPLSIGVAGYMYPTVCVHSVICVSYLV